MRYFRITGVALYFMLAMVVCAYADGMPPPPHSADGTTVAPATANDGTIFLTPDKTKILHLPRDASSIIITNPAIADIRMDTPRLLVVMPRTPGTTSFTVLDRSGATVVEKTVIITATQPKYVRIRRVCGANDQSCAASSYYYGPNGCYQITPVQPAGGNNTIPPAPVNPVPATNGASGADDINSVGNAVQGGLLKSEKIPEPGLMTNLPNGGGTK